MRDDPGDVSPGFDVVDSGRLAEQTGFRRERRTNVGHTTLPLDGAEQRRLLAADKGAGPLLDMDLEIERSPKDIFAEKAFFLGLGNGQIQAFDGEGIFGAAVDIGLIGPGGKSTDGHPFENRMGIAFQSGSVHERARVAFIGVADHILFVGLVAVCKTPFESGGEPSSAPTPEARISYLFNDRWRIILLQYLFEGSVAVSGQVIIYLFGVNYAAVGEDYAALFYDRLIEIERPLGLRFSPLHMPGKDLFDPSDIDLDIEVLTAIFIDHLDLRLAVAHAKAPGDGEVYIQSGIHLPFYGSQDFISTGGDVAGAHPNHYRFFIVTHPFSPDFSKSSMIFAAFFLSRLP